MSCELHRQKFFEIISVSGSISAEELEHVYQGNRHIPSETERLSVEAKTRSLFNVIAANGLKPPTHSADGLPKAESQPGYAAVYDLLRKMDLLGDTLLMKKAVNQDRAIFPANDPALGLDGRDAQGFDRWGYNREGLDRNGFDRDGYDKNGLDRMGFNRHGFNRAGLDLHARNALGFDFSGVDKEKFKVNGYHEDTKLDHDGYNLDGFNANGYDRDGYNCLGVHYDGNPDPNFRPDAEGYYPDGLNAYGFGRDGYDAEGYDRFGFGRDGYNRADIDRNGYNRDGSIHGQDAEGYSEYGYKQERREGYYRSWNRAGYDNMGFCISHTGNQSHISYTGFDRDGHDKDGQPRKVLNAKGRLINAKYDRDGFDADGYDQWGYHKDTGLTAPDKKGRQYNTDGWVYDKSTDECIDPKDPTRRVKNQFVTEKVGRTKRKVVSAPYTPPAPSVPITPFADMTEEHYNRVLGSPRDYDHNDKYYKFYSERIAAKPTVAQRRDPASDTAVMGGVKMRCPHCGQFTGGNVHQCPNFGGQSVTVYHSGIVVTGSKDFVLFAPHKPDFDPQYDNREAGGYHLGTGLDHDGYDRNGYNERGFDHDGYNRAGFDVFGYDRDGYDGHGYNNAGVNRRGEQRGRSMDDARDLMRDEGLDLLANEDLARMYSQVATGLIGKPRRVVLKEGGGFATDMKGTIYADPYPLGRDADPRHNLVVTRAGIYHELGHEQFTPQDIWAQVLDVTQGKQDAGLGEAAKQMLPRFYNIVEDGRMERVVSGNYAGAAEILAASCRLEPRWGEEVGEGVSESDQVFWSLLYTGLPYYRVRQEVRDGMSPNARKVFDELEPLMQRAVRGAPDEAFQAAVHIAKRFEEEGFIQLPPKDYSQQMPQPQRGQGQPQQNSSQSQQGAGQPQQGQPQQGLGQPQPGQGQGHGGASGDASQEDEKGKGRNGKKLDEPKKGRTASAGKQEDEKKGQIGGASQEDEKGKGTKGKKAEDPQKGREASAGEKEDEQKEQGQSDGDESDSANSGAGNGEPNTSHSGLGDEPEEFLFGNEVVDSAVRSVERDAASAIENGARSRSRANVIGRPLHNALPDERDMSQRYRDSASGMPKTVTVVLPKGESYMEAELEGRRGRHREIATLMAKPLKAIREQTEERLRRQSDGRLDRRQLVNAYKGMDDVYTSTKEKPQTSFAASIAVDMSGSMNPTIKKKELYDAVMTLGDCFDMLDMPHEVRAFGSGSAQVKAMREKFDPARAAFLASGDLGGTQLKDTASLAHSSLLACEEKNRMMVCMSDGVINDHQESVRVLKDARKNGVVTFGIYFGKGYDENKLNELYGRGSWAAVEQLGDMPKVVAQRLASIFKSMK